MNNLERPLYYISSEKYGFIYDDDGGSEWSTYDINEAYLMCEELIPSLGNCQVCIVE